MDQLEMYRNEIDEIDREWVRALARRFTVTEEVGRYKHRFGLPASDELRETRQIAALRTFAAEQKLDPDLIEQIFRSITQRVRSRHREIDGAEGDISRSEPRSHPPD